MMHGSSLLGCSLNKDLLTQIRKMQQNKRILLQGSVRTFAGVRWTKPENIVVTTGLQLFSKFGEVEKQERSYTSVIKIMESLQKYNQQ